MRRLLPVAMVAACAWGDADRPVRRPRAEPRREARAEEAPRARAKDDERERPHRRPRDRRASENDAAAYGEVITVDVSRPDRAARTVVELKTGEPALVLLVVMDTVRADHTSLCGYARPTTPTLVGLKATARAWSCDAYSPGAWTLPSHASYLTGASTDEHDVHTLGVPLAEKFDTLAEVFAGRGYQTLFVSANPTFAQEEGGFWQGFDRVVLAEGLDGPLRGELGARLRTEFARLDPTRPVFAVINVFDAHDPYPPIPKGLDWVAARPQTSLHPKSADPTNPYFQFVTGKMAQVEQATWLPGLIDAYDHGVSVADDHVRMLLDGLRREGWLDRGYRVVITSDHGEHLGEHGLLRHGSAPWQTVARVPFILLDTTTAAPLDLPTPFNVTATFWLLRDGVLPDRPPRAMTATARNDDDFKPSWDGLAVWRTSTDKWVWLGENTRRYDLSTDPGELHPLPVALDDPFRPAFDTLLGRHRESLTRALNTGADDAVIEQLRKAGYVQ